MSIERLNSLINNENRVVYEDYTLDNITKILFASGTNSAIKSEWLILKSWYELPNLLQ